jgi:hypothetical protein
MLFAITGIIAADLTAIVDAGLVAKMNNLAEYIYI